MTLVEDVHSRLNETAVALVVPVESLESTGTALAFSTVELHEAA